MGRSTPHRNLYCSVCKTGDLTKIYRNKVLNGANYRTPTWLNIEILGLNAQKNRDCLSLPELSLSMGV